VKTVLVDTGAWLALLSRGDQHAAAAAERYADLSGKGARLVTTNYIVDETATRLRYGAGLDAALAYRRMLDDSVKARRLRIAWIDETIEREAWRILEQYRDVALSLTDATSAVTARRSRIEEVFGFDRDFEALGLLVLPGS
jgi:predicted nucleic acid-binding protein